MKKYFITGLIILLPVALTLAIVIFIFNLLTVPFAGAIKAIFAHYDWLDHDLLFLSSDQLQQLLSQVLVLFFLFFMTVALGAIARGFFMYYLLQFGESILGRIPMVRAIYRTSKDVVKTIFTSTGQSFKQVVLVPFPYETVYSIGFITRENLPSPHSEIAEQIAVFVPTTPNPTSGFMMMYKPTDLIYLDMKVEEAFKFVVSCGVLPIPFKTITREEAKALNPLPKEIK